MISRLLLSRHLCSLFAPLSGTPTLSPSILSSAQRSQRQDFPYLLPRRKIWNLNTLLTPTGHTGFVNAFSAQQTILEKPTHIVSRSFHNVVTDGRTRLHSACEQGLEEVVAQLLASG